MKNYFKIIVMLALIMASFADCRLKKDKNNNLLALLLALTQNQGWFFVTNTTGADMYAYSHTPLGNVQSKTINLSTTSSGEMMGTSRNHVFVALKDANKVGVIDMASGSPELALSLPVGVRPNHMYASPDGKYIWIMNDGNAAAPDKGADMTNCNTNQASVTIIKDGEAGAKGDAVATVLKTVCVGRGHHKAAFSTTPLRAFVSNITDGTVTVIDADPASGTFLTVLTTISLCVQAEENKLPTPITCPVSTLGTVNKSAPHGIDYSSVSGKIYNSSTGYGTVAVINPTSMTVETNIAVGFTGTLHMSPDKKFVILKGADKTTDVNHMIGKINAIRVADNTVTTVSIQDVSPDHFMFTPNGSRLYVVSAVGGAGAQLTNLKNNVVLVYDTSALPAMTLVQEITVGKATGSHRSLDIISHSGEPMDILVPNDGDMTISVIDYATNKVKQTLNFTGTPNAVHVHSAESHNH